jgi:hypothetical protein
MSQVFDVTRLGKRGRGIAVALFLSVVSAHAQKYDITPLVGGVFGGTVNLEQTGVPNFHAHVDDSVSFGVAGGIRFDADDCQGCNLVEFRWLRQNTHLGLSQDPLAVNPLTAPVFHPRLTLDRFMGDFTREWNIEESNKVKPYLMASLGVARMATPLASTARFVFGIGTGIKIFPAKHWGIRFQAEYLPIVMHADVERVVCAGGCIVALGGGLMNQFVLSAGPTFRF